MGPNYTEIVVKCLTGDFGIKYDSKEDIKLQQAFRTQIVNVLDRALANIWYSDNSVGASRNVPVG